MVINSFINSVKTFSLAQDVVMILSACISVACFVPFLVLCLLGKISRKKRLYYLLVVLSTFIVQTATALTFVERAFGEIIFFPCLSLGVNLIAFTFLMAFGERQVSVKKEHKNLISLIDKEIEKETSGEKLFVADDCTFYKKDKEKFQNFPDGILPTPIKEYTRAVDKSCQTEKAGKKSEKPTDESPLDDLDFSHVKNIMARLDYYSLNPTEKRQVDHLKSLVGDAERGVFAKDLKGDINDGLGSLLKIMSKYGV